MKELLKIKKLLKKIRPKFRRTDQHKKKRLNEGWRRPKGYQNKMRLRKKGYPAVVEVGYRTPKEVRGTTDEGLKIIKVDNKKQLETINPKKEAIIIGKVGRRKKEEIIKAAMEKNITITNLKVKEYQEKTAEIIKKKEEKRKKLQEKKEKKAKEELKKAKEEKKEQEKTEKTIEELTEEEKKKQEKKEKDKILTSKKETY